MSEKTTGTDLKSVSVGRYEVFKVDPSLLRVQDGWNSRNMEFESNQEHIQSLSASIEKRGVDNPLVVEPAGDGTFYVRDGHCRLLAVQMAIARGTEIKAVPVRRENKLSSETDKLLDQISRNSGKPLEPVEKGEVFARLVRLGWSEIQIAEAVPCPISHVRDCLRVHAAPPSLKAAVANGEVALTSAVALMRQEGPSGAASVIEQAKQGAENGAKITGAALKRVATSGGFNENRVNRGRELANFVYRLSTEAEYSDDNSEVILRIPAVDFRAAEDLGEAILNGPKLKKGKGAA